MPGHLRKTFITAHTALWALAQITLNGLLAVYGFIVFYLVSISSPI